MTKTGDRLFMEVCTFQWILIESDSNWVEQEQFESSIFNVYRLTTAGHFTLFSTGVASITAEFGGYFIRLECKSSHK